jgi:hypothetical protein
MEDLNDVLDGGDTTPVPDDMEKQAQGQENRPSEEQLSGGQVLVSNNLLQLTRRTSIPSVFTFSLGEKSESVDMRIDGKYKIGSFTYRTFPTELVSVVRRIWNDFNGIYFTPGSKVDEVRRSVLMNDGFFSRPRDAMRAIKDREGEVILSIIQEEEKSEFIQKRDVEDSLQNEFRVSETYDVKMWWLDAKFYSLCKNWEFNQYFVDELLIRDYFNILTFPDRYIKPPSVNSEISGYMIDMYFGYYEKMLVASNACRSWAWEWHRGFISNILEAGTVVREKEFTELLRTLKIDNSIFSKETVLPARLTSGDVLGLLKDELTAWKLNKIYQLHLEIGEIEKFDVSTILACFICRLMFPYSLLTPESWCMIDNYLFNHVGCAFLLGRRRNVVRVSNMNAKRPVPMDRLEGDNESMRQFINFMAIIGSGSCNVPETIRKDAPRRVTSYRNVTENRNVDPDRFFGNIEAKLHAGEYFCVEYTAQSQSDFIVDDQAAQEDGSDMPIIWNRFVQFVYAFRDHSKFQARRTDFKSLSLLFTEMVEKREFMRNYYLSMNRITRVLSMDPLTFTTVDQGPSMGVRVPITMSGVLSKFFVLDTSRLDAEINSFAFVAESWNVNTAFNKIGRHFVESNTLLRLAVGTLPTDLKSDVDPNDDDVGFGNEIRTARYPLNFLRQSDIDKVWVQTIDSDPLTRRLMGKLAEEGHFGAIRDFPIQLTRYSRLEEIMKVVVQFRNLFGWDTCFRIRSDTRVYNTLSDFAEVDADEFFLDRKPQLKYSNVISPGVVPFENGVEQYWRERTGDERINDQRGLDTTRALTTAEKNKYAVIAPGTYHVRPILIGPGNVTTLTSLVKMLWMNQTISVPVTTTEYVVRSEDDLYRIEEIEQVNCLRFDFIKLQKYGDLERRMYWNGTNPQILLGNQENEGGAELLASALTTDIRLELFSEVNETKTVPELHFLI